jgi:16S rRNA (cytosine1407-C5)-methyltransferase
MCASPGGKTTQLSETFPNAWIVANESSKDRLPQLIENTERMGAESISLCLDNGMHYGENHPEAYDIILLDAPCSGEGTAFKHDTAVSFWNEKGIKKIARLQGKLIESAWKALKPGGWLLYSTCTLNTFENEEVLAHLQSLPDFD